MRKQLLLLSLASSLTGCGTINFYWQAIGGHLEVLTSSRPIEEVIVDDRVPAATRAKLDYVRDARRFAVEALALPDNGSYQNYADLERPFVLWNVFATPEFSVTPKEWCFVMVGCVTYRGYFNRDHAEAFAAQLRADGYDVYVAGVAAYSTLGWFSDPVLNTMLRRSDAEVAALLFHELAHQKLYVKGDTTFNESFATVIELEGTRRWLASHNDEAAFGAQRQRIARHREFTALMLDYRARLAALYRIEESDADKRATKQALLAQIKQDYTHLRSTWDGDTRYDKFFDQAFNNAHFAAVGAYHGYVDGLQAVLVENGGDLVAFYRAAEVLARLPSSERAARLARD